MSHTLGQYMKFLQNNRKTDSAIRFLTHKLPYILVFSPFLCIFGRWEPKMCENIELWAEKSENENVLRLVVKVPQIIILPHNIPQLFKKKFSSVAVKLTRSRCSEDSDRNHGKK